VPEVKRLRAQHDRLDDRGDEGAPTDYDFYDSFRRLWAAQHHLVWAANQLERWTRRLAQERREPEPVPDALLTDLRNALEHLDEAVIEGDGTTATAGDNPKQNKSLRRLPDSQLLIGTGGLGLFQLVDPAELERRAWAVVTCGCQKLGTPHATY
jgi:hypothetical protein